MNSPHDAGAEGANRQEPKYRIGDLPPKAEGQGWVTLVSCGSVLEADLVRSQLEGAGLSVFVPDENLMATAGWGLNTNGYVRVQVRADQYEAARDLLCATGDAVAV